MAFLRSTLFWIFIVIATIVTGVTLLVLIPFTTADRRYDVCSAWCRLVIKGLRTICGVKYEFVNMDEIPKEGPVIILAKHQSAWETMAFTGFIPRRLSFVYKKELHKIPIFGWVLASLGMFSIDRAHGRSAFERMKEKAPDFFKSGRILVLFPEGTRTAPGTTVKYKSGGARLSEALDVPIIPAALNSGECWKRGAFEIEAGKITVVFGPKISPNGLTVPELNEKVKEWIEGEMPKISPKFYPTAQK